MLSIHYIHLSRVKKRFGNLKDIILNIELNNKRVVFL